MSREAAGLRLELRRLALAYADARALIRGQDFYESLGRDNPVVLFRTTERGNGNFIPASYDAIRREPSAMERTRKRHTQLGSLPTDFRASALEMDSSNSSDALLMNIFCYPGVGSDALCDLLGVERWSEPTFGQKCRVPGEKASWSTELDMCIGDGLSVEAKLTEQTFTRKPEPSVRKYRDLDVVFDVGALPQQDGAFESYQLIRNVLAAFARRARFLLIHDRRRPDLRAHWGRIQRAIKIPQLGARCSAIEWQAVAGAVPEELGRFLAEKYGIVP